MICIVPIPGGITRPVGTVNVALTWSKSLTGTGWPVVPVEVTDLEDHEALFAHGGSHLFEGIVAAREDSVEEPEGERAARPKGPVERDPLTGQIVRKRG